jgi:hypothetical protein
MLPYVALSIMVVSLALALLSKIGRSIHLSCTLGVSVLLFLTSLFVWKRDFEQGYNGMLDPQVMLGLSGCLALVTGITWLIRRDKKTVSIRQFACVTLVVALILAATQQVVRFDKMSSYEREVDAARELQRAGIQIIWDDWSVSQVAIRKSGIQDVQLERIKEFPHLRLLSLEGNPITDSTLACIANVEELYGIYLTDTDVGDAGLAYLANALNLEQLWLGGTKITDDGLVNLRRLTSLGYVDLSNTEVSDAGLEKLSHLKQMYYLHLPGTRVTKAGMEALGDALPGCRIYGTPNGKTYMVQRR